MDKELDAFPPEAKYGGARSRLEIKILLCYVLRSVGEPISKTALNTAFQTSGLINFFETNNALSELVKSGLVKSEKNDGDEYFRITDEGVKVSRRLETDVTFSVRDKAVRAAMFAAGAEKIKKETRVSVEKIPSGYMLHMDIPFDSESDLMRLSLYAADGLQAQAMGERFQSDPVTLYNRIADVLTGIEDNKNTDV